MGLEKFSVDRSLTLEAMKIDKDMIRGSEWLIALLLLVPASFLTGRCTAPVRPVGQVSRDTVIVYHTDTIVREKPVYIAKRIVDTLRVPVTDTIRERDTLYLSLPREQRTYADTAYRAWVSGYDPALDSIRIFAPVRCVTVTEKERVPVEVSRRWSLGVTAGYGAVADPSGSIRLAPYLGLGVTYNIISW